MVTPRLPVRAPRIYPDNPHVRICGGPGSATTLVYPTEVARGGAPAIVEAAGRHPSGQAVRHAVRQRRTGMSSRWKTSGLSGSRRARRLFSAFAMGGEMGRIRPTNVFERPGESRMTPPVTSMSSQVRSRISCLRQPAARRVRRRWWGRRFPTRAVRRGPDERRVGGRCQGRGPCEAWLGVHRRAVMPRISFSTPRHVPSETLECHRSWPAM